MLQRKTSLKVRTKKESSNNNNQNDNNKEEQKNKKNENDENEEEIQNNYKTKCITQQGIGCFILQIINLYEIILLFLSAHVFKINDIKVELGLMLSFFLLSKVIKITYLIKKKRYGLIIMIVLCLDYIAVLLYIKDKRKRNIQLEEKDKQTRMEWIEIQEKQQKKIDTYIESLQPKPIQQETPDQINTTITNKNQFNINLNNKQQSQLPTMNDFNGIHSIHTQSPQKFNHHLLDVKTLDTQFQTQNTLRNLTEPSQQKLQKTQKDNFTFHDNNINNLEQFNTINHFNNNNHNSNPYTANDLQNKEINQQQPSNDYQPQQQQQQQYQLQQQQQKQNLPTQQQLNKQSITNPYQTNTTQQLQQKDKKQKIERSLTHSIKSSVFKKFKFTEDQIQSLINNKFITIYLEDELNSKEEEYFINRKIWLISIRVLDSILVSAPCVYLLSYQIWNNSALDSSKNNNNLDDIGNLSGLSILQLSYISSVICVGLGISLLNTIQQVPFRQMSNQFFQLIKNTFIISSITLTSSLLWALSTTVPLPIIIYQSISIIILLYFVYTFFSKLYKEFIQSDRKFSYYLYIISLVIAIGIYSLQMFGNVIIILNEDIAHEALLQFRKMLEQGDKKVNNTDVNIISKRQKIIYTFLKLQNYIFICNISVFLLISIFVNRLYEYTWDSQVVFYYKIMIPFIPISLIAIMLLLHSYEFFNKTLTTILIQHYNRLIDQFYKLQNKYSLEQNQLQEIQKEHHILDNRLQNMINTINQISKQVNDYQAEDIKINKRIIQFQRIDKSYKQESLKLNSTIIELKNQFKQLQIEIEDVKILFDHKCDQLNKKQQDVKSIQKEIELMVKDNGFMA